MKSQARRMKRMEARRQELIQEIESRKRIWNAVMAGDARACIFLSKQYLGIDDEPVLDDKATVGLRNR